METINREAIDELIQNQDAHCISIYLPTHVKGKEVLGHKDRTALKVVLKEMEKNLVQLGLSVKDQEKILKPAQTLLEDGTFWHNMGESLVLFLSENHFSGFKLPYKMEQYADIASIFYLTPLLPLMHTSKNFYLLTLSIKKTELFEASPVAIEKMDTKGLLPESLEKVVGEDYEQKLMEYRSLGGAQGGFVTYGYGEGADDKEKELMEYFRALDQGLKTLLTSKTIPLIIATVDEHFGLYKKINNYPQLIEENISGNPDYMGLDDLHNQGLNLIEEIQNHTLKDKIVDYQESINSGLTDAYTERVITNSFNGKVDSIFINREAKIYGFFDQKTNKPLIHKQKHVHNEDLLNLAAIKVYDQKGEVFLLDPNEMPEPDTQVNARYRYPNP